MYGMYIPCSQIFMSLQDEKRHIIRVVRCQSCYVIDTNALSVVNHFPLTRNRRQHWNTIRVANIANNNNLWCLFRRSTPCKVDWTKLASRIVNSCLEVEKSCCRIEL